MDGNKLAGSVIFKLVGAIAIAILTMITSIGVAIFRAVENPTGEKKDASIFDLFNLFGKKSEKKED